MYHTLILAGNLGRDPEMRFLPNGQAVTSFNVASSRKWKDADGTQREETVWFKVSTWGKLAEICNEHLKKGSKVLVEGRLTPDPDTGAPRVWTNKDGKTGASFEVTAQTVRFLSSVGQSEQADDTPF
ncbi:Single-stranded DNA-binding protein [Gammaproteobacteria bacterium]